MGVRRRTSANRSMRLTCTGCGMAHASPKRSMGAAASAALALAVLVGCTRPASPPGPQVQREEALRPAGANTTPTIAFLGVSDSAPEGHGSSAERLVWLRFDVVNSSEASLSLPSRPSAPQVVAADGARVDVLAKSVRLTNGGGGWGASSGQLGDPYLDPGGAMHAAFGIPHAQVARKARWPLTTTYAPTGQLRARFVIP